MGGEKTEQPSAKRLRDAREKGQVAKSTEVVSTCVILACFAYVWLGWNFLNDHLKELFLSEEAIFLRRMELKERFLANFLGMVHRLGKRVIALR